MNLKINEGTALMNEAIIDKANEFSRDFEVKEDSSKSPLLEKALRFIYEEIKETEDAIDSNNRAEIIDGFGDVAFLAINGIYKEFRGSGDDHATASNKVKIVMTRICDANLGKKQADGTILYKDGKVQKPASWKPPQYEDIL